MIDLPIQVTVEENKKIGSPVFICEKQIEDYLTSHIFSFDAKCFDLIKEKYGKTAFFIDNDNFVVFTLKNAILIKSKIESDSDKIKIIGGKNSKISKVTSLSVDKASKNIIVVDNHKSVLFFNQKINGDVGPIYHFKIEKTIQAESIEVDENRETIRIIDNNGILIGEFDFTSEE